MKESIDMTEVEIHDNQVNVSRKHLRILSCAWSDYRWVLNWWSDILDSLIHSAWLHFTFHYYIHTRAHTLVPTVMSSLPLLGSGFQRRMSPFLSIAELSPASAASFSQQQLTRTEPQWLSNSVAHQPHDSLTHWIPAYNISAWTT